MSIYGIYRGIDKTKTVLSRTPCILRRRRLNEVLKINKIGTLKEDMHRSKLKKTS